ncbi:MAG: cobalamin-dependent protein [Planctomycetota bacterium]
MTGHRPRILLAKIGLDGHDRGVKVLARHLRDGGLDVIYTGLWQSPQAAALAAMQEDADILGISLHSAAHMTIVPEVLRWRDTYGIGDTPVVVGGIIPESDRDSLLRMGVTEVYHAGASIGAILEGMKLLAAKWPRPPIRELLANASAGKPDAIARLLTVVSREGLPEGQALPSARAAVIGVTGVPGVGKSSFIGRLAAHLRAAGKRVAILAVDPSSPVSGGALLGDRLRMTGGKPDPDLFIRSIASEEMQGGLGPRAKELVRVLAGFGFDVVLIETVGAGQTDYAVTKLTPNTLLLVMPQAGDDIQFSKSGIMELAAAVILNKTDLPGAEAAAAHLTSLLPADRPFWKVSTLRDDGFAPVVAWVESLSRE